MYMVKAFLTLFLEDALGRKIWHTAELEASLPEIFGNCYLRKYLQHRTLHRLHSVR